MNKTKKIISKIISILLVVFITVPLIPFQAKAGSYDPDPNITFSGGHGTYKDYDKNSGVAFFENDDVKKPTVLYKGTEVPNNEYSVEYTFHDLKNAVTLENTAPSGVGFYRMNVEISKQDGTFVGENSVDYHIMNKPTRAITLYNEDADRTDITTFLVTYGDTPAQKMSASYEKREGYRFNGWFYRYKEQPTSFNPNEPLTWDLNDSYPIGIYASWSKLTKVDEVAPTCTKDGTAEYWTDDPGNKYADAYGQEELDMPGVIEATGHKWGDPVYTWSNDESEVTASRKCQNDASHVEAETVKTEMVVVKEPTDTEDGILQIIATFKNSAFKQQVREYGFNRGVEDEYALISELTEWIKGGKDPLSLRFKNLTDDEGTFDQFLGIKVDDELVDEDNYTKEKGSVIVNLKPEYLEKLSVGEHTIEAMFIYGSAKAKFTIKEAKATEVKAAEAKKEAAKSNATKTGDSSPLLIAIIVMAVSALAIVTMIVVKKKKKN